MGTLVQNNRGYEATSDNSFFVAYTNDVVANNLLVVIVGAYHDSATINTPTDTIGTTYSQAGSLLRSTASTGPDTMLALYYGIAPTGGANTVTVTFSTSLADKEIKIWEISGVDTATPLNQTNAATGLTVNDPETILSGSITTTVPGFIIKAMQEFSWGTHAENFGTPTTGWTEFGDTATGSDSAYRNETNTGTFNGGFSITISNNAWCCRIVAFADKVPSISTKNNKSLRPSIFTPGIAR